MSLNIMVDKTRLIHKFQLGLVLNDPLSQYFDIIVNCFYLKKYLYELPYVYFQFCTSEHAFIILHFKMPWLSVNSETNMP